MNNPIKAIAIRAVHKQKISPKIVNAICQRMGN
jgi:hypothetical protein